MNNTKRDIVFQKPHKKEHPMKYFMIFFCIALVALIGMIGCGTNNPVSEETTLNGDDVIRMTKEGGENSAVGTATTETTTTTTTIAATAATDINTANLLGDNVLLDGTVVNQVKKESSRYCLGGGEDCGGSSP
ncbi:MAG: hypothetical protein AUJ34_02095 [Parcubacteria group bacterium CG1_02_41_12]|nr:MAG: hypothetical protein AUJ34_02095 [Parcubacteria group bacterium CG1_02_41_12]PIR57256.1 MAG: hypothetical protein COU72_01865 [Parcubacteria group bacterium CG10_big_fil_rev_8_21_14_0_10_41_35]